MILVYITCKDERQAEGISKKLLQKKLIACANIFPIKSLYRWKGMMQNEKEVAVIAKTKESRYSQIKKEIKKIHSYDVPCIIKIKAEANKEYGDWVGKEVK